MTTDPTGELSPTLPGDGPDGRADDLIIVRSEEQVRVSTEIRAVRRVRVRKVIVTEERTVTVNVQREELQLDEESLDGGPVDQALGSADPVELVLYEQRPVIGYETVPIERVRVGIRVVSGEETVHAAIRREVLEDLR